MTYALARYGKENAVNPKSFVIDVDGVLTTGQFFYSVEGKVLKVFGPDDHEAIQLLRGKLQVVFVTGDHRGFEISRRRIVDDMKFPLELVSTTKRIQWIQDHMDASETIYMGDGIFDHLVFAEVGYSICPSDGFYLAREHASFVTKSPGGNRALAEACLHILEKFYQPFHVESITAHLTPVQGRRVEPSGGANGIEGQPHKEST